MNQGDFQMRQWMNGLGFRGAACVVVMGWSATSHADLAAVMDQASAGADMVIAVPSMSKLNEAIAELNAKLGIQQPEMEDALASFKQEMGVSEGIDDNGPMLMVIQDLATPMQEDSEPDALILMLVTDYATFVKSINGTPDGVTEVQLQSDTGFAKQLGNFAVLGETKESVEAYAAGEQGAAMLKTIGSYGQSYGSSSLISVYFNLADLAPAFNAQIEEGIAQMKAELENSDVEQTFDTEKMATAYASLGKTFVNGTQAVLFTMDSTEAGAGFAMGAGLKEGSDLAGYFTGKSSDGSVLARLPDQSYLYASGIDLAGINIDPLIDMAGEVMEAMSEGPMAGMMAQSKQTLDMMKQVQRFGQVWYAPNAADPMAMMSGGFMSFLNVYEDETGQDGNAMRDQWQKSMEAMGQVAVPLDEAEEAAQMTMDVTYQPSAMQVEGVRVDQYQINMQLPPEMMQGNPMAMMMMNGYGGYVAATDDAVMMTTGGTDPKLITDGLKAIGKNDGLGSAAKLNDLRANQLPEALFAEGYLSIAGVADMANPMLQMFGGMPPVQVPADLSPIAMGLGQQDGSLGGRFFIPMDVMLFVKTTAEQFVPAGMGGGNMGDGGNGAPPAPF